MASIYSGAVGARMKPLCPRTKVARRNKRIERLAVGGPLAGRKLSLSVQLDATLIISLRGQTGHYHQSLWVSR